MWPILLDMTKEESVQNLRCLELDAFAGLVTAFRAQGCLNSEKQKLLQATGEMLNISQDRHKAEIRRAVNDEKLNTIAYHIAGHKATAEDWSQEGRRLIPLLSRVAPQTVYSAIADEAADNASRTNRLLPHPAATERKRSAPTSPTAAALASVGPADKSATLDKVRDKSSQDGAVAKQDDAKKRRVCSSGEQQVTMGPPKSSRTQQLYRLRTKAKQKDNLQVMKIRNQQQNAPTPDRPETPITPPQQQQQQQSAKRQSPQPTCSYANPKSAPTNPPVILESAPNIATCPDSNRPIPNPPNPILETNSKPTLVKNLVPNKTIKVCPPRKTVTTTTGQKLVVVGNPQSIASTSILQRTLTIPFVKNISVKNYDKFKILPSHANTNVQISPLFATGTTTGLNHHHHFKHNPKHKVVTVRTNGTGTNKLLPFTQIQMLNAKGSIKVLPFGSKLLHKPIVNVNTSANPIYVVNSKGNHAAAQSTHNHHSSLTDYECEIARHTIQQASETDESSTSSSSDSVIEAGNHLASDVNHTDDDEEVLHQVDSASDVFSVGDGDGDGEQQSFYVLENEDERVISALPINVQPSSIDSQLDSCQYSQLHANEIQLQEELVTLDCEPMLGTAIPADAVLEYNTYDS